MFCTIFNIFDRIEDFCITNHNAMQVFKKNMRKYMHNVKIKEIVHFAHVFSLCFAKLYVLLYIFDNFVILFYYFDICVSK